MRDQDTFSDIVYVGSREITQDENCCADANTSEPRYPERVASAGIGTIKKSKVILTGKMVTLDAQEDIVKIDGSLNDTFGLEETETQTNASGEKVGAISLHIEETCQNLIEKSNKIKKLESDIEALRTRIAALE